MRFSVGYQLFSDQYYIENIIKRKSDIAEVYFSWGDFPNGRNSQLLQAEMTAWEAQEKQIEDLQALTQASIPLNLLFNATCYGKDSQSRAFFQKIGDTVCYVGNRFILKSVTTTSPLIASFIKDNFPDIDVRASVNMGIGTVEGMRYVSDCFDSFYLKRECNRDLATIRKLRAWCEENGKTLYALANSGCLNHCSAHTFHDNLVSHESEIAAMDNGYAFTGVCGKFLQDPKNRPDILDCTSFIRPEDISLYEGLFPAMKLATRVNADPVKILRAYIDTKQHIGSVWDLTEPNHSRSLYPCILENSRIQSVFSNDTLKYTNIENALIQLEA